MIDLKELKRIIDIEFHDLLGTSGTDIHHNKIRAYLKDDSFVDIWFSKKIEGRFSYHWERRHINNSVYRHDNFPDPRWNSVSTFPKHFHKGTQNKVEESHIEDDPVSGVKQFMDFIRKKLE